MKYRPAGISVIVLSFALVEVAAAAPVVPSSALPGRERERFMESPVERFMQPGPYTSPQLFEPSAKPGCRVGPASKRHRLPQRCR
jgi:hypothetical protein